MAFQKADFIVKSNIVLAIALIYLTSFSDSYPYAYTRWDDYDYFPVAKPIQDSGTGQVVGTVNPLRPWEPWILDCILVSTDKVVEGKRHPRCQTVDETNVKEYAKFLYHVQQWEAAYPERADKWNARFPDGKDVELRRYERLKELADMHNLNLPAESKPAARKEPCGDCSTESASVEIPADSPSEEKSFY